MQKRYRLPIIVIVLGSIVILAGIIVSLTFAASTPWIMPVDVAKGSSSPQTRWNDFGYQTFIALNWPADPSTRGMPDSTKMLGARDADNALLQTVWQTYKRVPEVFLPYAAEPASWNSPRVPDSRCSGAYNSNVFDTLSKAPLDDFNELNQAPFPNLNVNLTGSLIDQHKEFVWYERAINESWFDYIVHYQFYNANNQMTYTKNGGSIPGLPDGQPDRFITPSPPLYAAQGVVEIKASWRVLDPATDVYERYYVTKGALVDPAGNVTCGVDLGLVGLHILRLTPTQHASWVWFTFEQVDNISLSGAVIGPDGQPIKPNFNPNGTATYTGGYQIGDDPKAPDAHDPLILKNGTPLPPVDQREVSNVSRLDPIPTNAVGANTEYQNQAPIQGTVWQYYQLVGSLFGSGANDTHSTCWVAVDQNANPTPVLTYLNACNLSNTSMESFVQPISCIGCHAFAAPVGDNSGEFPVNQIFSFSLEAASTPQAVPVVTPEVTP